MQGVEGLHRQEGVDLLDPRKREGDSAAEGVGEGGGIFGHTREGVGLLDPREREGVGDSRMKAAAVRMGAEG